MANFLLRHLWEDIHPDPPVERWLALRVLRLSPELVDAHPVDALLYEALHFIRPADNKYLNAFNSSRVDMIAELVEPPETELDFEVPVNYYPRYEPSYWLASHVLGLTDTEIAALTGVPQREVTRPAQGCLLLLRKIYRILQKDVKPAHPILAQYQRSRYLLLRYYLDATYHILSN